MYCAYATPRSPRTARRGFTVVELMVVCAIIALLVAMVMPSYARTRELSRRALCAANQHQIHLGMVGYAFDNNREFQTNIWNTSGSAPWDIELEHITWLTQKNYKYLKDNSNGDDILSCPNRPDWDWRLPGNAFGQKQQMVRRGYFFMWGHRNKNNAAWTVGGPFGSERQNINKGKVGRWYSPHRMSDDSTLTFTADILESGTLWPPVTSASHGQFGPVDTQDVTVGVLNPDLQTAGSMVGALDGSVAWKTIGEMDNQYFSQAKGERRGWW
ncbi:MAG: prepilin-type N-terminal cleavage/methylation domain-containing protein [Phycisphaera sp.]|nr:prepilin-type N-terminal cleavage/methylation domain-containing protein [Phycisphaera sp.]